VCTLTCKSGSRTKTHKMRFKGAKGSRMRVARKTQKKKKKKKKKTKKTKKAKMFPTSPVRRVTTAMAREGSRQAVDAVQRKARDMGEAVSETLTDLKDKAIDGAASVLPKMPVAPYQDLMGTSFKPGPAPDPDPEGLDPEGKNLPDLQEHPKPKEEDGSWEEVERPEL